MKKFVYCVINVIFKKIILKQIKIKLLFGFIEQIAKNI